jgi:hypothetical protein
MTLEKIREFPAFASIKGTIHSACGYDIAKNFFLFDETAMHVIKIPQYGNPTCTTYDNVFCSGIQTITKNFNYALCRESPKALYPGLRFFDMESMISRDKCSFTLLKNIDVGVLGYFEKGTTVMRFGFLNSLTDLVVTPILHRNMNRYMGVGNLDDYYCVRQIKDKYIMLKKTGLL